MMSALLRRTDTYRRTVSVIKISFMKNISLLFIVLSTLLSCTLEEAEVAKDYSLDKDEINKTIQEWDKAWTTKDVELAVKYYATETDWTNAFGDRVQSKSDLRSLLELIFELDFVMSGENNYGENEITFLNDSIATVRSHNVRVNQKWPDGTAMDDRHVDHLRVYNKTNGKWLIIDHMISQAWPKQRK